MLIRLLAYPLQGTTLVTGLCIWAVTAFLLGCRVLLLGISDNATVSNVIWLAATLLMIVTFAVLLLEYFLDILEVSVTGRSVAPILSARYLVTLMQGDRRFLRQLLVLMLVAGLAVKLYYSGHTTATWLVCGYGIVTLPAMMASNVLYHRLLPMLNPFALLLCIIQSGWLYLLALLLLVVAVLLIWLCFVLPIFATLLLLPAIIYAGFLCMHATGLGIHRQYYLLFPLVDFKADRQQLQAVSAAPGAINKPLGDIYEILLSGNDVEASRQLTALLDAQHWANFEAVYRYTAEWYDPRPALHIVGRFLDRTEATRSPMRALELAAWALQKQDTFTQSNPGCLLQLAEHAVTPVQFQRILQMIRNHLQQYPDSPKQEALRRKALQLAAENLKDEALFHQLQAQFQQV